MHPQAIIDHLTSPDIQNLENFILASGFRTHVIQTTQSLFNEGEKTLEAALAQGKLNEQKGDEFGKMEGAIESLLRLGLNSVAYRFAIKYYLIKQKYEYSIH